MNINDYYEAKRQLAEQQGRRDALGQVIGDAQRELNHAATRIVYLKKSIEAFEKGSPK